MLSIRRAFHEITFSIIPNYNFDWNRGFHLTEDTRHLNLGIGMYYRIGCTLSYAANLLRLGISALFFIVILLRPLFGRPMSLIWLRVVQSEKPLFTMLLGGIGGFASVIRMVIEQPRP